MLFDTVWHAELLLDDVLCVCFLSISKVLPVNSILENTVLFHLSESGQLDVVFIELTLKLSHREHTLDSDIL